jgi:uncharacterized protein YrrD
MEFKEGAGVYTLDGSQVGSLDRVVIDPRSGEVTHLVVKKGFLFTEDKVVPVDLVERAGEDQVRLRKSKDELGELENFMDKYYVEPDQGELTRSGYAGAKVRPFYQYPPYGMPTGGWPGYGAHLPYVPYYEQPARVERNVPEDAIALKEGAQVRSADGEHTGDIEKLLVDSESQRVTHLVLSSGLLLKSRKLIPAAWIREIDEETVLLAVGSDFIEGLPDYQDE